jgi:hypothetical protein
LALSSNLQTSEIAMSYPILFDAAQMHRHDWLLENILNRAPQPFGPLLLFLRIQFTATHNNRRNIGFINAVCLCEVSLTRKAPQYLNFQLQRIATTVAKYCIFLTMP